MARRTYSIAHLHPRLSSLFHNDRIMKSLVHRPTSLSRPTLQRSYSRRDRPQRPTCPRSPPARSSSRTRSFPTKPRSRVLSRQVRAPLPVTSPLTDTPRTVDMVERAAGLTLFSDGLKHASKHICKTTKCEVIVRRFDDAQKRPEIRRAVSAPR